MNGYKIFIHTYRNRITKSQVRWFLFFIILGLGILARTWEFHNVPPGLNPDEASIGVDAFDLLHYGMDRNGIQYPVQFISWGGGQNTLYGYLLIPFIAFMGLTSFTVRLPMLLSGIAALPLSFYVAKETLNEEFGLLSMFFLAISPWHIMLSRWGLESNLFPFVFLVGYACLLNVRKNDKWFIAASSFMGLCFYAYGTSYAMIPIFTVCAIAILIQHKLLTLKTLILGLMVLFVLAIPIGIFIIVNTRDLNSIQIGPITIPRFPVEARFVATTVLSASGHFQVIRNNLSTATDLLVTQTDGLQYNVIDLYGYFYKITFPLEVMGIVLLLSGLTSGKRIENALLLTWIGASLPISVLQQVNINRFNIIFVPLIFCIALSVYWFGKRSNAVLIASVVGLLVGFVFFSISYHSKEYHQQVSLEFHDGLLPALEFAQSIESIPICVGDSSNPYIFALFTEHTTPANYLKSVKYSNPKGPVRNVSSFGRYTFGWSNCHDNPVPIRISIIGSTAPIAPLGYTYNVKFFNSYAVYYPTRR